jgi:hypothetical protein
VCRFAPDASIPSWAHDDVGFFCVTRTSDELSIVCGEDRVPDECRAEKGWIALKLEGPFPFSMTGVLAAFLDPLAQAKVSIFAISTFDTDYVLIKQEDEERAVQALAAAGHEEQVKSQKSN